LSLIANTAPVAFGGLGTPIIALKAVTGIDELTLSAMVGRQLPFFSLIVPFWVVWAMAGFRGMLGVWPAALTAGLCFAVPQFLVSNFHGPWLVDIVASLCSMASLLLLLRFWRPATMKTPATAAVMAVSGGTRPAEGDLPVSSTDLRVPFFSAREISQAWLPWLILSVLVFVWGVPAVKRVLNGVSEPRFQIVGLHNRVVRAPPVVTPPTKEKPTAPEEAVYKLSWLSATGTGILAAAILAGLLMGFSPAEMLRVYGRTLKLVRLSLLTIAAMLALGYVTRYSGADATLGLALAKTGPLYPFFGTLLGWLGVALTGSDTSSNVLFGSLQKITSEQLGLSPTLMAAANSSGGVMGKMVDAQSIVVASTATNWYGHEGDILRYVFFHSLALAALVGILVYLQAYVPPFSSMVVR
jgi:lactate permease